MKFLIGFFAAAAVLASFGEPAFAACDSSLSNEAARACLAQDLTDSDKRINAIYKSLMASHDDAGKASLRSEQRAWLKERDKACSLDNKEANRSKWLQAILGDDRKTICVVRFTFARVSALNNLLPANFPELPAAPAAPKLQNQPQQMVRIEKDYILLEDAYLLVSTAFHKEGKWYFELTVDRGQISKLGDVLLNLGVASEKKDGAVQMVNVRHGHPNLGSANIGFGVDLDNGAFYTRVNGTWRVVPGMVGGITVSLNQTYRAIAGSSSPLGQMLQSGLIKANFGDKPFAYAMPDGYRPFDAK